jgi:Flp pilus assembly protein TadG
MLRVRGVGGPVARVGLRADEDGAVTVLFALAIFFLFVPIVAIALDIGNWYAHKRELQNKVDAAALAGGVQYTTNNFADLLACRTGGAAAATAASDITNAAKSYSGVAGLPAPWNTPHNTLPDGTSDTVVVNSTTYTAGTDYSDHRTGGVSDGNPCYKHPADATDYVSPKGGYWVDVKAQETGIHSLFGGFFSSFVPAISARARVEIKEVGELSPGGPSIPFVGESGDYVPCAWAEFVDANTGLNLPSSQLAGQVNPIPLTVQPQQGTWHVWSASLPTISVGSSGNDIAVLVVFGDPPCSAAPGVDSVALPSQGNPFVGGVDWVNVWKDPGTVNATDPPGLAGTATAPGTCGTVGYLYHPGSTCNVTVNTTVDFGGSSTAQGAHLTVNDSNGSAITMTPINPAGSGKQVWTGTLTVDPTALKAGSPYIGDYAQVGQHALTPCWARTAGTMAAAPGGQACGGLQGTGQKNGSVWTCSNAKPCTGLFTQGGVQQATYLYDPEYSDPVTYAEITDGSGTPIPNSYNVNGSITGAKITVKELGLNTVKTTDIKGTVQTTGNRTGAVDCGNGNSAQGLEDAIISGCANPQQINWSCYNGCAGAPTTLTYYCSPQPNQDIPPPNSYITGHTPIANVGDCVPSVPGNKTNKVPAGVNTILDCTQYPNHWVSGLPYEQQSINPNDPRIRDIYLTTEGSLTGSGDFPIVGFAAFYVTGWTNSPNNCNTTNEKPPSTTQQQGGGGNDIWGHYMDYVDLTAGSNPGVDPCDLTQSIIFCKPQLVR